MRKCSKKNPPDQTSVPREEEPLNINKLGGVHGDKYANYLRDWVRVKITVLYSFFGSFPMGKIGCCFAPPSGRNLQGHL